MNEVGKMLKLLQIAYFHAIAQITNIKILLFPILIHHIIYSRILVKERCPNMNSEEKKSNIRRQIEETEYRQIESNRYFEMMEDYINQSIARNREALDNKDLNFVQLESLSELETSGYIYANGLSEKREQLQHEYFKQLEQYRDELNKVENEEGDNSNESWRNDIQE